MKKSYIILSVVAAAFAACSQNDIITEIADKEVPVGFETFSGLATKSSASTVLEDYHETFGVWGYKTVSGTESAVMDPYKVLYDDNGSGSHDWDYDGDNAPATQFLKYWDKTASKYEFDAYAPYSTNASIASHVISIASGQYAANENLQTTLSKTLNTSVFTGVGASSTTASTDWMMADTYVRNATGTPAVMGSELVTLDFKHILSKVIVVVKTKADFPKDINITSVSLDNVYGTGSYNGTAWTTSGTAVSVAGVTGTISDSNKTDGANNDNYYTIECLVMPQATAAPQFSVTYTIGTDTEIFAVSNVAITNVTSFVAGTAYTITATIGPDPINFDCTVTDWTSNTTGAVVIE